MKLTSKIAATFAVIALVSTAHAAGITGGISFTGNYTPQDQFGNPVTDLASAKQIAFGTTLVNLLSGTSGSFTVIDPLNPVTMFTPLVFAPAPVLPPAVSALWTTSDNGHTFSFFMSSFVAGSVIVDGNVQSVKLAGSGTITYSGPLGLTSTPGTWVGTFTDGASTFSWASSTAATANRVPDGGATVALLGISFLGLGGISRFVRRK